MEIWSGIITQTFVCVVIKAHILQHMPKYPKCSVMLIKYVQDKIMPLLQVTANKYEQVTWDERVQYFEDGQEEPSGKEVNLVYFFALWTRSLYRAHPEMMQKLHEAVARDNSVSAAYIPSDQSNFYYLQRNQPVDLTFALLVIRAMLLRARPTVTQSLPSQVDIHLLDWMESVLDMFPMSEAELHGKSMGYSLSILLNQLYELRG